MFQTILASVRKTCPLVHNIINYVTVSDCANMLLACGVSPIMADDGGEVEEITALYAGPNINIDALNQRTITPMLLAGEQANVLEHPVVLGPVDAGTSKLCTETAERLLKKVRFVMIRGNISEIKTLACGNGAANGVDADVADRVTDENLPEMVAFAKAFATKAGAVITITGAINIVVDSSRAYYIRNGHPMMTSIMGTGCQFSATTVAFVVANREQALKATAATAAATGYAGELAYERHSATDGNATYRNGITGAIYNVIPETLEKGARYEAY